MALIDADIEIPGPPEAVEPLETKGSWPKMLKISSERELILKEWLTSEITLIRQEKEDVVADWKKWQKQYWAQPEQTVKNFPFTKAANIVVPLTAIAVEAVHARIMNTIFTVKPFWSIRPRTKRWIEAAKPIEKFLQAEVENENSLNAYGFCSASLMELTN